MCVDANLVVRLVTDHPSVETRRLRERWRREREELMAPLLLRYEATNALRRLRNADETTEEETERAIRATLALPIRLHIDEDLHAGALAFAARFSLAASSDAHCLALADRLGAEFWTTDRTFANAVQPTLPWVHLVAE
jgi:predicted nucleic acid-binding protein